MAKTTLWSHSHPGIYIEGGDAMFTAAAAAVTTLRSRPIGSDLIDLISKRCGMTGQIVTIKRAPGTLTSSASDTQAIPDDMTTIMRTDKVIPGTAIKLPGKGASSVAAFNPYAANEYAQMVGIPTPVHIALGHELIHCLHFLAGNIRLDADTTKADRLSSMMLHEEASTVGLGPYKNTRISENALRKEHNLTLRTFYGQPGDCDALPSLA